MPRKSRGFLLQTNKIKVRRQPEMITPIETKYAGRRFRSRTEARWAIIFDALDIDWRFEPDGYNLWGNYYLPDFELHLPTRRVWVEVKPQPVEYKPLLMLCALTEQPGYLVADHAVSSPIIPCHKTGHWAEPCSVGDWLSTITDRDALSIQAACNKGLSARWGHGEKPRRPRKPGGRGPRAYQRAANLLNESSGVGNTFSSFGS